MPCYPIAEEKRREKVGRFEREKKTKRQKSIPNSLAQKKFKEKNRKLMFIQHQ